MFLYQRLAWAALIGLLVGGLVGRFTLGLLLSDDTVGYVTVPFAILGAFVGMSIVWSRHRRG